MKTGITMLENAASTMDSLISDVERHPEKKAAACNQANGLFRLLRNDAKGKGYWQGWFLQKLQRLNALPGESIKVVVEPPVNPVFDPGPVKLPQPQVMTNGLKARLAIQAARRSAKAKRVTAKTANNGKTQKKKGNNNRGGNRGGKK